MSDEQVTDYLKKKGFAKTEAVFRRETAYLGPDGRPARRDDDPGRRRYLRAFLLLRTWIENNLDIYKVSPSIHSKTFKSLTRNRPV
jgi:transcription initiation factor TFIID subunit 5